MSTKKKKHPLVAASDLAAQDIAQDMANHKMADYQRSVKALREVCDNGDVNSTRKAAAETLLRLHGLYEQPGTKTTLTAGKSDDGKLIVEVVHVTNPPPEDD